MLIKQSSVVLLLALALLLGSPLRAAVLTGVDPTLITVGSGSDVSYLVIDESSLYSTPLEFAYHYTYDSNNLMSGEQMMQAVTNAVSSGLGITILSYPSYGDSLLAFTYNGNTVTPSGDNNSGTFWGYFDAGGTESGSSTPLPSTNAWNIAGIGFGSRYISPGSWDGWTVGTYTNGGFSPGDTVFTPPSVAIAAVPEPSATGLLMISLLSAAGFIRWKLSPRIVQE